MEDTIKIELLTPLTGNFTSRELERQWEEGEYEYDVYEGLPLEGTDLSQYESEIKEAIEKYNAIGNEEGKPCNLMDYFDGSAAIKEKVISAIPSVTDGEKGLNSRKSKSEMEKSMFIFGRAVTMKFRSVIPIINRRKRK